MAGRPETAPEMLREAAEWFDLVDRLIGIVKVEDNASGDVVRLVDALGGPGQQIQDDLRDVALLYESMTDALRAVKRFAVHAEERNIAVPLWAGLLWDEAIEKTNDALDRVKALEAQAE